MKIFFSGTVFFILILFGGCISLLHADIDPEKIIVLANEDSPDSVSLAHYYIGKRNIPVENIVLLKLSLKEEISWAEFVSELYNPLLSWAVTHSWIKASPSVQSDGMGRNMYAIIEHKIDFIVLSKDVPLKIRNDETLIPHIPAGKGVAELMINNASVDSEISLIPFPQSATVALTYNPLFDKLDPGVFSLQQIVRVSRLDGPTYDDAKMLIDNAIYTEQVGLAGRAYIDYGKKYEEGDRWLKETAKTIESMGFDISYDEEKELFGWGRRFDAPALYFGWWSNDLAGPISDPFFRFAPGALGIHIHSFSADTIRSNERNWVGPLVARGITGTVGNVYEPYLQFTHHPHLFMEAISKGKTFGEAGYYSLPALSWQEILVGDPLYRPFKLSLDEQLALIDQQPFDYAQYVVIRKMNLLIRDGLYDEASELGIRYFNKISGFALLFTIGKCQFSMGSPESALETFGLIDYFIPFKTENITIAYEMAQYLESMNAESQALKIYIQLLNHTQMDNQIMMVILPQAIALADKNSESGLSVEWNKRLVQLKGVKE
jgi:uncharacterized protein (TIGR03790 family)